MTRYIASKFGFSDEDIEAYILPDPDRYEDRFRDYRLDSAKIQQAGIELGTSKGDVDWCLRDFGWLR